MNCNSLSGKINIIQSYVATYEPDIIAITKTKINRNFDDNELLGNEYTVWRNDRNLLGGGVLVALKNQPELKVLDNQYGPGESISLNIQIHPKIKFYLIIFYRPPSEYCLDNFVELLDSHRTANCVYIGDFNFPDVDWIANPTKGCVKPNSTKKALHQLALDSINEADLKQLIHEPTHIHGNT